MLTRLLISLALIFAPVQQVRIPGPGGKSASGVTWTLIQNPSNTTGCSGNTNNSTQTCTLSGFTATGTGHLLIAAVSWFDLATSSGPPVIDNGNLGNNGSDTAFTHCPSASQVWQNVTSNWVGTDCYYIASSAGGTTSLTVTLDWGGTLSTAAWGIEVALIEVSKSTGSPSFDTSGVSNNGGSLCSSPCSAPSLTLAATDYVLHWAAITTTGSISSVGGAFTNPFITDSGVNVDAAFAGALNQTGTVQPSYTYSGGANKTSMSAVAFR